MAEAVLEDERVLLSVATRFRNEFERHELRVVQFRDPVTGGWLRPRLEKRRYLKIDGTWTKGKPSTFVAPDVHAIADKKEDILKAMDRSYSGGR